MEKICKNALIVAMVLFFASSALTGDKRASAQDTEHVKWKGNNVDLITMSDREVITVTRQQLGTMFGPGKQPFKGKRIGITVNSNGPKGGISGPLYQLRPAWDERTGAKLEIVEMPVAGMLSKTMFDLQLGQNQYDGFIE